MSEIPDLEESALSCFAQGTEGDLARCVVDGAFASGASEVLIGLLIAAVLLSSMYIAGDGTVVVPSVVTILVGGALVPLLPPQYVMSAYAVVFFGTAIAVYASYQRFATRGGF